MVTVNRLVRVAELPALLDGLGFDAMTFSYPRREPFGSSSMVYGDTSDLVDFSTEELIQFLDEVKAMKRHFPVFNPTAGLSEIQRHLMGETELFSCLGGHKYFYLDWELNIWRCEAWPEPLGSVFDFATVAEMRDRCTRCMMACYRDTSIFMHAAVAAADAAVEIAAGHPAKAAALLLRRSVALSVAAVVDAAPTIRRLARRPAPR